ncbi:mycothiol synthase [Corynebacterium pyruviciproducens]
MEILSRAFAVDGVEPFSEQYVRGLTEPMGHTRHQIEQDGQVIALISGDGSTAELVVDPAYRRHGLGTQLYERAGLPPVWAHGDLPAARAFAAHHGLVATRILLVMGKEGYTPQEVRVPEGFRIVTAAEECDDEQWVRVNNEAFSWHPEQGGWDVDKLTEARATTWYDPQGVFFLYEGDRLAGFHWTKRVDSVGEVYVIGLGDGYRGRGLGGPLLTAGLNAMAEDKRIILYVEGDNEQAVAMYKKAGFTERERHVVYEQPEK